MKILSCFLVSILMVSCANEPLKVTNPKDYNTYLASQVSRTTSKYFELWNAKIGCDSTQLLSFSNVAAEYHRFFEETGEIDYLKKSEKALQKAVEIANINQEGYARSLARNYISQHRFKEALDITILANRLKGGKRETQALFFDVHMELGNYDVARAYLDSIKNVSNFGYLIRAAKWNDYKGDLNTTIHLMEKAMDKAESSNNKNLKLWSYTNIADYYGHAGRIHDSYKYYLKALKLNPKDAYAKKGIAWIVYSHEKNGKEALRILNTITEGYEAPDYDLLKAEIHDFLGNSEGKIVSLGNYLKKVNNPNYGSMYNALSVDFFLSEAKLYKKALKLAEVEVLNRPTPASYGLLAKTLLKMGKKKEALEIVESKITDQTYEPNILFTVALVLKANGKEAKVKYLKEGLMESAYEMGPLILNEIAAL
ncbi:MAG: hypothetical protein ACFB0A_10690 [Croceivirga sp.]